jgi:hypothetical protein
VLRVVGFATGLVVFLSISVSCVESLEIKLISPIGAAVRSIIPGWGQVYTRDKLGGAIIFLSVGVLSGGGIQANDKYLSFYDSYRDAVLADSGEADFYFDRSNQYYKLSRFLLYTAAGIWAYSIMDAYVDAHIYNARQQARMIDIKDERLRQLRMEIGSDRVGADPMLDSIQWSAFSRQQASLSHW